MSINYNIKLACERINNNYPSCEVFLGCVLEQGQNGKDTDVKQIDRVEAEVCQVTTTLCICSSGQDLSR